MRNKTSTWRRVIDMDIARNHREPGERGLLVLRVARDFRGIMSGYAEISESNKPLDRFVDSLFHSSHWS